MLGVARECKLCDGFACRRLLCLLLLKSDEAVGFVVDGGWVFFWGGGGGMWGKEGGRKYIPEPRTQ